MLKRTTSEQAIIEDLRAGKILRGYFPIRGSLCKRADLYVKQLHIYVKVDYQHFSTVSIN
ncbi:hypothetical protein GCM10028817_22060 [Spirosoma pomorum]